MLFKRINEHTLSELWSNPDYVALRERVQSFQFSPCTFCGGCDFSEANEEDCFGNTFPTCGGCLWAQGIILIGLLILIGITAWLGLENILEGFNRWTWTSLAMVVSTLLVAGVFCVGIILRLIRP